ncbi:MAG TPA: hypothetical protein VFD45_02480 [Patescibacteria group bacterium]|nr:hypothetical protein [Patescibacteria group bacterium]
MNKFVLSILGVAVITGVALAGLFSLSPNKNQNYIPVSPTASCVDFDPPSTIQTVSYNGAQYNLIKIDAEIVEEYKFKELTSLGNNLYALASNYFGQKVDPVIVFQLKNTALKSPYVFDIFIKDGAQIPDYVKNCKSTGGKITVAEGDSTTFPPSSFNKTEIIGLSEASVAPGYVHNGNVMVFSFLSGLSEVKEIGKLKVGQTNYSLFYHLGTIYLKNGDNIYEYLPSDAPIPPSAKEENSLQLKKVTFVTTRSYSWWTPACKPAIYLYPQKTEEVNVKINTKGVLTLTIPSYPKNGWTVIADKEGLITLGENTYPYLYYESKIPDSLVKKPQKGYVVEENELGALFNDILPRLGLNEKESKEFKEYWERVLPNSPYYFVGIMTKNELDQIEPISFAPSPDVFIRVRLYFEALAKKVNIEEPVIIIPQRKGFTAVEWGGMVKTDKENPFTCSQ